MVPRHARVNAVTRRLRWGLVGASDIAATRMLPALRARGDDVVAVASGDVEHGAAYALAHGVPHATADLTELLGRADVDAVYISSTNDRHHRQTLAAAAAGKHVLCEKPMALTVAEAEEMVGACAAAGVVLAVNHHLPGSGAHRTVRRLVADGAVGRPLAVRVHHAGLLAERLRGWRLGGGPGAGVILDITSHDASVVRPLLGREALDAVATAVRQGPWAPGAVDAVMACIRYEGDVLVCTHDAFTVPYAGTALEVHGDEGSILASGVMTQSPGGTVRLRDGDGEREVPVADQRNLYEVLLEAFAAAVAGDGVPTVSGADGVRALATALAVEEAARTGRRVSVAPPRAVAGG